MMVVNNMDWEMVDVKVRRRTSNAHVRKSIRVSPKANRIVISGDLISDAGWNKEHEIVSLYKSGNLFMFKPNKIGSIHFVGTFKNNPDGTKTLNGHTMHIHSFDIRSTLLMVADTNSRFAKRVDYDAWVDGNSIIFKYEKSIYADENKAVNE